PTSAAPPTEVFHPFAEFSAKGFTRRSRGIMEGNKNKQGGCDVHQYVAAHYFDCAADRRPTRLSIQSRVGLLSEWNPDRRTGRGARARADVAAQESALAGERHQRKPVRLFPRLSLWRSDVASQNKNLSIAINLQRDMARGKPGAHVRIGARVVHALHAQLFVARQARAVIPLLRLGLDRKSVVQPRVAYSVEVPRLDAILPWTERDHDVAARIVVYHVPRARGAGTGGAQKQNR